MVLWLRTVRIAQDDEQVGQKQIPFGNDKQIGQLQRFWLRQNDERKSKDKCGGPSAAVVMTVGFAGRKVRVAEVRWSASGSFDCAQNDK